MGRMKQQLEQLTEGGVDLREVERSFVCKKCVEDPTLQKWVSHNIRGSYCSYCKKTFKKPATASMPDLVMYVVCGLEREYDDAENGLGRDNESETGWAGETYLTSELLERELELEDLESDFSSDLCNAVGDRTWSDEDPYGPRAHELLSWSWKSFRKLALHRNRFFYVEAARQARKDNDETPGIDETLESFIGYCSRNGLYVTEPKGVEFYRCQLKQSREQSPFDPGRMGPPPNHLARQANRMSPAGIPRFYGAEKPETAMAETMDKAGRVAVGCFKSTRAVTLLDLTRRPPTPSIFDTDGLHDRPWAHFLHEFLEDFTAPISRDGNEHIEYVPTQVVAEYIEVFGVHKGRKIDGIRYPSAKHNGSSCVVLFADNESVVGKHCGNLALGKPWLKMVNYEERRFDPKKFAISEQKRLLSIWK